jgi:hypothetical protein
MKGSSKHLCIASLEVREQDFFKQLNEDAVVVEEDV